MYQYSWEGYEKIVPFCDSAIAEMVLGEDVQVNTNMDKLTLNVNDLKNDFL